LGKNVNVYIIVGGRRRGLAAVEFACFLPLLVLILSGKFQVGRITEVQPVARNAAREASLGHEFDETDY
jgi:Flp pilus assembly protein TadG